MELRREHITIAVTVYSRREFILDAIHSALNQTVPVRVIVVEDCGPDATLRDFIMKEFGARIGYFRNSRNRGLFDNWNACLEYCPTSWISILHDDDILQPGFVQSMLELYQAAPERALYFGRAAHLKEDGKIHRVHHEPWRNPWRDLDLRELADECIVFFPGQLLNVSKARSIGGFRKTSYFTGDWDMWFRLALKFGAAQTEREVSMVRWHYGEDRGTSRVERTGCIWALDNVQRKRNLALLQKDAGIHTAFNRINAVRRRPIPSKLLLRYARDYSPRFLTYNWWLFIHSRSPHWRYTVLQWLARFTGPAGIRVVSELSGMRRGTPRRQ